MPQPIPPDAEVFRDDKLPGETNFALRFAEPGRVEAVAAEIAGVVSGRVPLIVFSLDQINAVALLSYLHIARQIVGPDAPADAVVAQIAVDLERMVRVDCPELARITARCRQGKGGQS